MGTVEMATAVNGSENGKRGLTVPEAAKFLGVSRNTIWRMLEKGTLKKVVLPGVDRVLLDVNDLNDLFTQSKQ